MSKKLLDESVIRRFQTLAGVKPSAGGLLEEGKGAGKKAGKASKPAGGRDVSSAMSPPESAEDRAGKMHEGYGSKEEEYMHEADEAGADAGMDSPPDMGDAMGADVGGGEAASGGEGGDVKAEVQALVDALNGLLSKVGQGELEVDVEAGGEEGGGEEETGGEEGGEEEGGAAEEEEEEEGAVMEVKKKKDEEEGKKKKMEEKKKAKKHDAEEEEEEGKKMEESLDLDIDDDEYLAEELTKRVAARLVAEMKKAKAMKEGKKGGTAGSVAAASGKGATHHTKPPKAKGSPTKGKVGTPFSGGKRK